MMNERALEVFVGCSLKISDRIFSRQKGKSVSDDQEQKKEQNRRLGQNAHSYVLPTVLFILSQKTAKDRKCVERNGVASIGLERDY